MTDDPTTKSMPPSDPPSVPPEPASFQLAPGDRVGNYVIREQIGEGGFAIVYAAEQEKPVRRKVALKIIKLGMDTKQVIARFEAERQALAMMDHPNVAKVFDAGSTDAGRPYFVMEYVAGTPINEYCDRQRLTIEERLGLFNQICEGVQHAHQKGIIHRDIKPTNVLVTVKEGEPQVKVIDFGVAKAITQRLTEKTIYTEQGQLIGTPEYMSPEQAEMTQDDIDTRSDIYSLGVLLYEILTGALPFDSKVLRRAALGEIQRVIREQEPPKPSTRFSSLGEDSIRNAVARKVDSRSLIRALRGDLDWITMKAMEKDRRRRYATAAEFAADVTRHLGHEPVLAAAPGGLYRFHKFIRRHRVRVVVTTVLFLAFVIGGVGTLFQAKRAAIANQQIAMQQFAGLSEHSGENLFLPGVGALFAGELSRRRLELGNEHPATMMLIHNLAALYVEDDRHDEARALYEEVLDLRLRHLGENHPDTVATMSELAELHRDRDRDEAAVAAYRRILGIYSRQLGDEHPNTIVTMYRLWWVLEGLGEHDAAVAAEAASLSEEIWRIMDRLIAESDPVRSSGGTLMIMDDLAGKLIENRRFKVAEEVLLDAIVNANKAIPTADPDRRDDFLDDRNQFVQRLVALYDTLDEHEKSAEWRPKLEEGLLEAHRFYESSLGTTHRDTVDAINDLVAFYNRWGRPQQVAVWLSRLEPPLVQKYERLVSFNGPAGADTLDAMRRLVELYAALDRPEKADLWRTKLTAALIRSHQAIVITRGPIHRRTIEPMREIIDLYSDSNKPQKTAEWRIRLEPALIEEHSRLESARGPADKRTLETVVHLVELYDAWGKPDKAAEWRAKLPTEQLPDT